MKLYVTYGSPYARLARIIVIEKALEDRVEIIEAKTLATGSPYYQINPSGRVPFSSMIPASAWKTASSSAPISTRSTASRASTTRRTYPIGRIFGSSSRRAACATASHRRPSAASELDALHLRSSFCARDGPAVDQNDATLSKMGQATYDAMSEFGASRHFAATQQFSCFGAKRTFSEPHLPNRILLHNRNTGPRLIF